MRRARTFPRNESRDQDTALSCLAPGFAVILCLFHEACVPLAAYYAFLETRLTHFTSGLHCSVISLASFKQMNCD